MFIHFEFQNKSVVFLRPQDHNQQIHNMLKQIENKELVIEGSSIEEAAAWNFAVHLYHLPFQGTA